MTRFPRIRPDGSKPKTSTTRRSASDRAGRVNDSQFSKARKRLMRSSKSRSRNKSNRNRSVGNIVNRVFDSSGPEGKVRGTPQQIIDKYNQLARDAQLSGDRVATENFQQHAEHYLRLLGTAQKEQEKQRDQQDQKNRDRNGNSNDKPRGDQSNDGQSDNGNGGNNGNQGGNNQSGGSKKSDNQVPGEGDQPDVIEASSDNGDSGLVETPESKAEAKPSDEPPSKPKRTYTRKPKAKKTDDAPKADAPKTEQAPSVEGQGDGGSTEAAE